MKYKVYRIGTHPRDLLEPEREELAKVDAEQIVLPRLEGDDLVSKARDADGIIDVDSPITGSDMESMPNLKVVMRTGVGVDVIDVEAATELGIAVVCVPDLWIREVANHAFALILACNRKLLSLDSSIRSDNWIPIIPSPVGSIHGEILGIVGFGRIGRTLSARARAFEMKVVAYDPYLPKEIFDEFGVESVSFDKLLEVSDYISVHSPKTDETTNLFDNNAFTKMKKTAYLINTSRGSVINQDDLIQSLMNGQIAGAGLDVLNQEPPLKNDPILDMENVILTPHSSYFSDNAIRELPVRCGREVGLVLTGKKPLNLVNPKVLEKIKLAD
tara:strand:+ start:3333 stop:4322 length:990 start_codon:yes stop_codon:yes gene_type:complete